MFGDADARGKQSLLPDAVVLPGLAVFNLAIWGWSIGNGFVYDDLANVIGNKWITDWHALPAAFTHHAAGFDPGFATSFYRPLMHLFYAITYAVAGPRPWAFHLVSVALHVAAVLFVYRLTRAVLQRWSDLSRYRYLPLIAALVFSIHPVHTEAVAWIAGITDLSYSVFGLLALTIYLRAFSHGRLAVVAGTLLLAALLSKETAAAVLLLMLLLEWIEVRSRAAWTSRAAAVRLAPSLIATAIYLGMRFTALGSFAPSAGEYVHGMTEYAAAAVGLFARYLGVLIMPMSLNVARSVPLNISFGDPIALTGFAVVTVLLAMIWFFHKRPLALLPLAFVVLPVLPALYFPAIESGQSVFGERYLYLPVLGIGCCLGLALEEARHRFIWGRYLAAIAVTLIVVSGSMAVVARNRVWADSMSLWADAVAKSPDSAATHEGFCFALYRANRFSEAVAACEKAIALDGKRVDARINHATALLALGRARDAKEVLDVALSLRHDSTAAWVNRGLACMVLGQSDDALASYRRALELNPDFAEAHNDLGVALVRLGRPSEALAHFEQAARIDPENPEFRANLQACPR